MENDTSAATAEWVREENLVSRKYLDNIPMRKAILKRLKETVNYEKRGMAFERGGKWYAYRNDGLQNQSVLYQMDRYDAPLGEWRVWLDPNTLSTDGTVALKSTNGCTRVSLSHTAVSTWRPLFSPLRMALRSTASLALAV